MGTELTGNILKHYDEHPKCFNRFNSHNDIVIPVLRLVDGHRRLTDYEFEYGGWDLYKDKPVHFKAICNKCNTILYKDTIILEEFRTEHFDAIANAFKDIKSQNLFIRKKNKKEKFNRQMSTIGKIMIGAGVPAIILFMIYVFLKWSNY